MRITEVTIDNVYKKTKLLAIFDEFIGMNVPCVKVIPEEGEYKSISSLASSLNVAAHRFKDFHISVKIRNGEVFLINTLLNNG